MEPLSAALALGQLVPAIIGMLKGPRAAQAAEKVVEAAKAVTGVESPQDLVPALQDPQLLAQFRQRVLELDLEETKLHLADVASARVMQAAALSQDDLFSKRFAYYFAAGWAGFAVVFFFSVTFGTVPPENMRVVDTILGFVLGTAIASIFNWLYGTTVRSAKKDDTINRLASGGDRG